MSTDYNSWSNFNAESALSDVDARLEVDEYSRSQAKLQQSQWKELEAAKLKARNVADAIQSKAAIDALLLSGDGLRSRRNRQKSSQREHSNNIDDSSNSKSFAVGRATDTSIEQQRSIVIKRVADTTSTLSKALSYTVGKLEELESLAKSCMSHERAVEAGFKLLNELRLFELVKNKCMESLRREKIIAFPPTSSDQSAALDPELMFKDIDNSCRFFVIKTAELIAMCAVNTGDFAVAIDFSRYCLKLSDSDQQPPQDQMENMWLMRALAFASIGCPYLANVHCRRAKSMMPGYPHIQDISAFLDEWEQEHAAEVSRKSPSRAVLKASIRQTIQASINILLSMHNGCGGSVGGKEKSQARNSRRLGSERQTLAATSGTVFGDCSVILVNHFHVGSSSYYYNWKNRSTHTLIAPPHSKCKPDAVDVANNHENENENDIDDTEDDDNIEGNTVSIEPAAEGMGLADVVASSLLPAESTSTSTSLSIKHMKKLMLRTFYEGQLLFLESMFLLAEVKYFASLCFLDSLASLLLQLHCIRILTAEVGTSSEYENEKEGYIAPVCIQRLAALAKRVAATSLVNIAVCRMHRYSYSLASNKTNSSHDREVGDEHECQGTRALLYSHAEEATSLSAVQLATAGVQLLDCASSRYRLALVFEGMKRYDKACEELMLLQELLGPVECSQSNAFLKDSINNVICDYGPGQFLSQFQLSPETALDPRHMNFPYTPPHIDMDIDTNISNFDDPNCQLCMCPDCKADATSRTISTGTGEQPNYLHSLLTGGYLSEVEVGHKNNKNRKTSFAGYSGAIHAHWNRKISLKLERLKYLKRRYSSF